MTSRATRAPPRPTTRGTGQGWGRVELICRKRDIKRKTSPSQGRWVIRNAAQNSEKQRFPLTLTPFTPMTYYNSPMHTHAPVTYTNAPTHTHWLPLLPYSTHNTTVLEASLFPPPNYHHYLLLTCLLLTKPPPHTTTTVITTTIPPTYHHHHHH